MNIFAALDSVHLQVKQNLWMRYLTVFTRVLLAWAFIPSGMVKIIGERFTSLSVNHPMGQYLEALHHTGYYYTFIGIVQVTAAILLLIPRTALLGAILYFPVILNICLLSLAVRFEGSHISSPLMVLANLYLLFWDYDKLKYIFVFSRPTPLLQLHKQKDISKKFPKKFFAAGLATISVSILLLVNMYAIEPRNSLKDCQVQCKGSKKSKACYEFCDCIHKQGRPIDSCLDNYKKAAADKDTVVTK